MMAGWREDERLAGLVLEVPIADAVRAPANNTASHVPRFHTSLAIEIAVGLVERLDAAHL
jgi:hypothetical protein